MMIRDAESTIRCGVNIEITNRCKLKCPSCARQLSKHFMTGTYSIPFEELKNIIDTFPSLDFCGQMSDPIYHPDFLAILDYIDESTEVLIHTNGHGFDEEWWIQAFNSTLGKNVTWIFGVDGLPPDSNKYRIGQDGEQVWKMMQLGSKIGCKIKWQYIVFNYNENDIDIASEMAKDADIEFLIIYSNRFDMIPEYKPSNEKVYVNRN